jgi:hypothetical protein
MNKYFNKKIITYFITIFFVLSIFIFPNKTNAQWAVVDAGNIAQSTITAANTGISSYSTMALQLKEYVLDGLGTMLVKQIVRQITTSVVTWINSGFQGSPSFLQNPGSFFLDVADQITGDFISKFGGPLQGLCSPFSIDIRIALAFKYRPNIPKRYACTITTIIKNSKNAVEGATLNGFTAGDFKQGGWPAFVTMTTEPQNNIYGAYLTAESELSWRVANAKAEQKDEISAGKGFLSWRDSKCTAEVRKFNDDVKAKRAAAADAEEGYLANQQLKSKNDCPVQTPGSVIQESLQNNLNGPLRELELADEINEVVNALFAQLVTQVLQKGLAGSSAKGPDGSSYLDSTIADLKDEKNPQVDKLKTELTTNLATYKNNALEYKKLREQAFNLVSGVKSTYDSAISCYTNKIDGVPTAMREINIPLARSRISDINKTIETAISPKLTNLLSQTKNAEEVLSTIQDIEIKANAAKTLNDLNDPSQKYSQLLSSGSLINASDLLKAREELEQTSGVETARDYVDRYQPDANRKRQECFVLY